ncbi:TPA_asm: hypothetical protein [Phytophthora water mold MELD virus]|nr:TPA_asm: hypothetical protein [Phytophthora water mold MELD virus]
MGGHQFFTESNHSGGMFRKESDDDDKQTIKPLHLRFGKYRYRSIEDVYDANPGYCRWLMNQKHLVGEDTPIDKFLKSKFGDMDDSFLMTWGKYKGRTIQQILTIDRSYLEWLSRSKFVIEKTPALKNALDELLS